MQPSVVTSPVYTHERPFMVTAFYFPFFFSLVRLSYYKTKSYCLQWITLKKGRKIYIISGFLLLLSINIFILIHDDFLILI